MTNEIDVLKLKSGDETAFRHLVETLSKEIYNLCLGLVPVAEEAEDLTQEVFIEVYDKIHSFKEASHIKTWIYRIAINKCYDYLKWKNRKKRFSRFQTLYTPDGEPIDIKDNYNHPGVTLENEEISKHLFAALAELPENQNTAFVLYEMQGLTYSQISETMKLSASAVESLLYRARAALRNKLQHIYIP